MKCDHLKGAERLAYFRALYENAKNRYAGTLDLFDRHMRQYRGSPEIDGSGEAASTVRNITYEIIESQICSDIPNPKVDAACYTERRERSALAVERLCRSLRDKLPFEQMNDLDERYTYIYGGSVFFAEWDNDQRMGEEIGGVRVHCLSPRDFIPQPGIPEVCDMEYCFLNFVTTKAGLARRYGIPESKLSLAESEAGGEVAADGDAAYLTVCFYKGDDGEIGQFVFSGDLILSDLPHYYRRKIAVCKVCGEREGICRCENPKMHFSEPEYEEVTIRMPEGDATLTNVRYYTPKSFPIVIRKNTSGEGMLIGQSDCEFVRPQQQAINKLESRILQKLLRSGVTPVMPEDATVSLNNAVFGQIIRMKPGETAQQYGKVDTTPDVSQDVAESERLYDHAKRVIGISDAYQGIDSAANESGVARQLRISQASGRLESKRKMKYTAYAELDRVIFTLCLAFADEPRSLSYKDAYGRVQNTRFDRRDFLEYDAANDEFYYNDGFLFSVDLNGGAEYQRESLWERNLENLKAGTLGDPQNPVTLLRYWQNQERAHYPHARENVEYFKDEVEKGGGRYGDPASWQKEEGIGTGGFPGAAAPQEEFDFDGVGSPA